MPCFYCPRWTMLFYVPCSSHWPWSESWWVSKSQKLGKSNENSANTFPFNIFQPSQILKKLRIKTSHLPNIQFHPISNFQIQRISSLDPGPGWMSWRAPQRVRRAGSEGRRFRGARWGFLRKMIYLRRIKEIYRYDCHWFSILWKSDIVWYITSFAG